MRRSTRRVRVLTQPVQVEATAVNEVAGDLAEIWRTLVDPETSLALDPTVHAAGRLGPERGAGEVQYFCHRFDDGRVHVSALEVTAYEHERRAVTRDASGSPIENGSEITVETLPGGTHRVVHRILRTLPPGTPADLVPEHARVVEAFAAELQAAVGRLFPGR